MMTTTYHGYTIVRVGLSHHVYRPGREIEPRNSSTGLPAVPDDHLAQSMAAAKRWIDDDSIPSYRAAIAERLQRR